MRVLVADTLADDAVAELGRRGHDCQVQPELTADDLAGRIPGFDVLVVRSTKVTAACIEAADRLRLVVRAGAGTNTIDTDAAAARGVFVANVPGRNAIAVAELTMALLLAIDRRIADNVADLRAGRWDKHGYSKAAGLYGSSMAVVGLGDIGLAVAERAVAFGLHVRVLDRRADDTRGSDQAGGARVGVPTCVDEAGADEAGADEAGADEAGVRPPRSRRTERRIDRLGLTRVPSLQELVSGCDIVSLHVPGGADTRGLVDQTFLSWLRPGAILLNTSRGDVVDESALLAALGDTGIRAGLDVFADEPSSGQATWTSPLAQHPNVVATHHIGASTEQAQRAVADGVVEVVEAFASGQALNCVNLAPRLGAASLAVRHRDEVGVLAGVLAALSRAGLNVEHMENRVFSGGRAAVATIDVAGAVDDQLIDELHALPHVLGVSVVRLSPGSA